MATYNETIRPTSIELVDQNGNKTYPTGDFSITAYVTSYDSGLKRHTKANFIYSIGSSSYASTKKLKSSGVTTLRWKSKSLTITDNPDRGGYPSGSSPDAAYRYESGNPFWGTGIASNYSSDMRFLTSAIPKDIGVRDAISLAAVGLSGSQYASTQYTGSASMTIAGASDGTYYPRKTIVWEDLVPVVSGMSPSAGAFVDETQAKTFRWTIGNVTAYSGASVLGTSVFKWRQNGTTHTVNSSQTSVTIPANTFGNGTVEWCVVHTTTDGQSNAESWQTITTVEVTPDAPTNLSPKNEVINGNVTNIFSWHHEISTGSPQKKAEIAYSVNNGATWVSISSVIGDVEYTTIPANMLPAGSLMWRVRTYNTDNAAGPWSTASIIIKARPAAPGIESISGVPLASVTWSSSGQVGYRVVFTDADGNTFDSGERYGNTNSFTSPGLLSVGAASCTVSVANSTGLWNSTTIAFNVSNNASGTITLSGTAGNGTAVLSWANSGSAIAYYVLKNGKPIAKVLANRYTDKAANGTNVYEVIDLKANGTYVKSNAVTVTTSVMGAQVFDYEHDGDLIDLYIRRNSIFEISKSKTAATSYYSFAGNTFPTAYTELRFNESISFTITRENNDCEAIYGLLGALCCIKDKSGSVVFGVLDSIGVTADRYSDLVLSFTRTEDEEGVSYE